jgi:hypothetical protein
MEGDLMFFNKLIKKFQMFEFLIRAFFIYFFFFFIGKEFPFFDGEGELEFLIFLLVLLTDFFYEERDGFAGAHLGEWAEVEIGVLGHLLFELIGLFFVLIFYLLQ